MAISSPGIGSGLDVDSIVSQLVALERRPIELLQEQKTKLTTQLSSFGLLQSYMANLQSAAGELAKASLWTKNTATSSASDAVAVTASATAAAGSYRVEVTELATAQSLASAANAAGSTAVIGTGTLSIQVGSGSAVAVEITSADQTLEGIRSKINAANAGVSASIVRDAAGARLVLTSRTTGAANTVTVTTSGGDGGLAALTNAGGLSQIQPALDAAFTVNGLPLTSASNTLTNVVDGITLTLAKKGTGPVTVTVGSDSAAMKKSVTDFVSAYNDVSRYLAQQTNYDESSKAAGALQGDRTAVGLEGKLRALLQQSSPASSVYSELSDIGLELQRDGTLKVNDSKLTAAVQNPAELALAFTTTATGFGQRFKALGDSVVGTDGLLSSRTAGLRATISRNEKDQARYEDRVARVQARLLRQYSALDASLGQLNSLSTYMNQQITNWNKSTSGN
jgi:flagellar hook-associated protein 2